jgi:hypothetical protein
LGGLKEFFFIIPNFGAKVWSAKIQKLFAIGGAPSMAERLKQNSKLNTKRKQGTNMKETKKKARNMKHETKERRKR